MFKFNLFILTLIYLLNCNKCIFLGKNGVIKNYPYLVSIYENNEHICGGVIIDNSTILTAAHCIEDDGDYSLFTIRVGSTYHRKGNRYFVKKIITHESHNVMSENDYDIAILKLRNKMKFSSHVKPISLHEQGRIPTGTSCQFAGWGLTEKEIISTSLRTVNMSIVTKKECAEYFDTNITSSMICARTLIHSRLGLRTQQMTDGDSGGPLVCNNVLVGIASFACDYLYPDAPSGFAKISFMHNWIANKTNNYCRN